MPHSPSSKTARRAHFFPLLALALAISTCAACVARAEDGVKAFGSNHARARQLNGATGKKARFFNSATPRNAKGARITLAAFGAQSEEPPTFSLADGSVREGDPGQSPTLSMMARIDHAVSYDIRLQVFFGDGSAFENEDFVYPDQPFSVTIRAGQTSARVNIRVIGDDEFEGDEFVEVDVFKDSGEVANEFAAGFATIIDDDSTLPVNVSVSPNAATSAGGAQKVFTTVQSDPNSTGDIQESTLLCSANGSARGGLLVRYNTLSDTLFLRDENDQNWLGGFTPGSAHLISTRYGTLDCSRTRISRRGDSLLISWALTPRAVVGAGQSRTLGLYLSVSDTTDTVSSPRLGSWTINSPSLFNILASMKNASSAVGVDNTLSIEVQNRGGVGQERLTFIVNTRASAIGALSGLVDVAAKTVALYDDRGRLGAPVLLGTRGATLSNSQGTLNVSRSTLRLGSQTALLSLSVRPSTSFGGNTKGLYLNTNAPGQSTPRELLGYWAIGAPRDADPALSAPASSSPAPSAPAS